MKKSVGLIALAGLAAAAFAAGGESVLLSGFSASIFSAKSLKTDYIMQEIGGIRDEYTLALKKPNLVRIDSPSQLVVGDGKQITTYDKKAKTYYKQPETTATLSELFAPEALKTWRGFFQDNAYKSVAARDLGTTTKGGHDFDTVEAQVDTNGIKTVTYYLDPSDKIARQVEFNTKHGADTSTYLLRTRSLDLNGADKDDLYTFTAPDGSTEVSLADVLAGKWYTSLVEAEKLASTTHRKIFVDFMASWCGPCKKLKAEVLDTDNFKSIATQKKLILCRIDTDLNPDLVAKYSTTAIPVQAILDEKGNLLSKTIGYGDPSNFYSWLEGATGSASAF